MSEAFIGSVVLIQDGVGVSYFTSLRCYKLMYRMANAMDLAHSAHKRWLQLPV